MIRINGRPAAPSSGGFLPGCGVRQGVWRRARFATLGLCALLGACAGDRALSLDSRPALAASVAALDRSRPGASPIPADRPLTPAEIGVLAVQNSPDLRAVRARRGVAQAQVISAGLLPDPVLSGSYNVLLAGPGVANAIAATLTGDVAALITLSVRRRAASEAATQVDADLVWQEWQTISQAQTLAIDLIEQERLLKSLERALDLLRQRTTLASQSVARGNATLQTLAPDISATTSLQTQYDTAVLNQQRRWQSLDALLGLRPDVRPRLVSTVHVPTLSASEADALLASLPRRRPDLIALQLGYAAQETKLRAAVLGQFPALTVGPNYGNDTSRVQTLGPAITVALPLFNRNRGAIPVERATREQLRQEYSARLAAADGGVRAMLANLALVERQLAASRRGLGLSRSVANNAEQALRGGLLDELSYVELVVAELDKEQQVISLEQEVADERTALATLLGVGLPPVQLTPPPQASLI